MTACEGSAVLRRCTRCGKTKSEEEFVSDPKRKSGYRGTCKRCQADAAIAYYWKNVEKQREAARQRRAANGEASRAIRRKHYLKNRVAIMEKSIRWREKYPDYVKSRYWIDPERSREKALIAANLRRARKYSIKDPISISIQELIALQGSDCYICGNEADPDAHSRAPDKAVIEHVISLSRGGTHTLDNLRVACFHCNNVKGANKTPEETRAIVLARAAAKLLKS